MLWLVEKIDRRLRSLSMVLLLFSIVFGTGLFTFGATREKSRRQDIGIEEKRWAEQRLWDLGYWAGPIDGTFDQVREMPSWLFRKWKGGHERAISRERNLKLYRKRAAAIEVGPRGPIAL